MAHDLDPMRKHLGVDRVGVERGPAGGNRRGAASVRSGRLLERAAVANFEVVAQFGFALVPAEYILVRVCGTVAVVGAHAMGLVGIWVARTTGVHARPSRIGGIAYLGEKMRCSFEGVNPQCEVCRVVGIAHLRMISPKLSTL